MRVLALNCGSSSLKFGFFEIVDGGFEGQPASVRCRARGAVTEIGSRATLRFTQQGSSDLRLERQAGDHTTAVQWVFEHLPKEEVEAAGHRIVHGGDRFRAPVQIDAPVVKEIEALCELAPLHNPAGLEGIRAAKAAAGSVPMVAVFDTSFHQTLPTYASTYALPTELAVRHRIRRYGFHGIAHASLAAACAARMGRPLSALRLITLHLGNGCSAAAIRFGESIDTSMGFTPLEGLVMGTRSGDLDPGLISYLARREGVSADDVERWLNEKSGLLGVSGLSHDMRRLAAAAQQDPSGSAALAIDMFCYRAKKYIGAYMAALGGTDAVVFGGGIGEHSAAIRAQICQEMEWCGLLLDEARNAASLGLPPGGAACISRDESVPAAYVVAVDEESWIARETARCLNARNRNF